MTAEGHFLFSISCSILAKNTAITSVLEQGDWWHIIPASILTCLIPDIDHSNSTIGKQIRWVSRLISRIFGHRGFTHSFLALFMIIVVFFYFNKLLDEQCTSPDIIQGMVLGYSSHILADMLTPAGVQLLWPCRWRFRCPILSFKKRNYSERILCIFLFVWGVWIPLLSYENSTVYYFLKKISKLQFNEFIKYIN